LTGVLDQAALCGVVAYLEMLASTSWRSGASQKADESPAGG
jgi:hypothetical protein